MSNNKVYKACLILILILSFIEINRFYHHYAKINTDSDQVIFWLTAVDLQQAEYHGPFLYGQNYNIPLESYLSQPLLFMGLDVDKALPITCLALVFLSFLLWTHYFYKQGKYLSALLCLASTIVLPVEWLIITSSARGFIGGIIIASFGCNLLYSYKNKYLIFFGSFLAFSSVLVNPNSVVFLLPFGLNYLLNHKINWRAILSALSLFILVFVALWRYKSLNANSFIHKSWSLEWTLQYFKDNIIHFNDLFKATVPIFYEAGASILIYILLLIFFANRFKQSKLLINLLIFCGFLLFSFGINKVNDGTASVFFPYSRMYLAIPFALLLFFSQLELHIEKLKAFFIGSMLIILTAFGIEQATLFDRFSRAMNTNSGVVQNMKVERLKSSCNELDMLVVAQEAKLLLFHSKFDLLNYGCASLNRLSTFHPNYERRVWLRERYLEIEVKDVIFIDWQDQIMKEFPQLEFSKLEIDNIGCYRVLNSNLKLKDLY